MSAATWAETAPNSFSLALGLGRLRVDLAPTGKWMAWREDARGQLVGNPHPCTSTEAAKRLAQELA